MPTTKPASGRPGGRAGGGGGWWGALLAVTTLLCAQSAAAESTFDALAANASKSDLAFELESLVMQCDDETDDRERRMCEEILRDRRARAREQSILVAIDPPHVAPAGKRGWRLTLSGCLVCAEPPVLADRPRLLTATEPLPAKGQPPAKGEPGKSAPATAHEIKVASLAEIMIPDPGEPERTALEASFPRLRAEAIVRLKAPRTWSRGEVNGIAIETIAWRVLDPCTGKVYVSRPASAVQLPRTDDPACKAAKKAGGPAPAAAPVLPERLTTTHVERALAPVRVHARSCFLRFRVRGRVDLGIDVRPDGSVKMVRSAGPLVDTPSADCVRGAALRIRFPAFKSHTSMHITYPVLLR